MNFNELKNVYIQDLQQNFIPFWEKAYDRTYGGVFTCYSNRGDERVSERKYIWSQGRFLWLSCRLQMMKEAGMLQLSEQWGEMADQTFHFLQSNALMDNGHVVYAVERDGKKIESLMDESIFADCFYVLGCNAYAEYKQSSQLFEDVLEVYDAIKQRISTSNFKSEPYPIPDGYRSHSIPMILLNVSQELHETARKMEHPSEERLRKDTKGFVEVIIHDFRNESRIMEMKPASTKDENTLLVRHVNPGHTLECVWFMAEGLKHFYAGLQEQYLFILGKLAEQALQVGWDDEYGGLLRFVDYEGGKPVGEQSGDPYEELVLETWDTKLWWPHSEALYTTLLLYLTTNDERWLNWYKRLEDYVFRTFPNEDKSIGEWIQIRDRKGSPIDKTVALPVKDPFHIIRSYILMIKLLEKES